MIEFTLMPRLTSRQATLSHPGYVAARQWPRRLVGALLWLEPLWIVALAPSILFPGRFWVLAWHPFVVVLLFLFWPLRLLVRRRWSIRTPLSRPIALLLLWIPLPLFTSIGPQRSWQTVGYLLLGVVLFVALVNWPPTRRRPQRIAWALLGIGCCLALAGPLLVGAIPIKLWRLTNLYARFGTVGDIVGESVNPNVLAGALLIIFPLTASLAVSSAWRKRFLFRFVLMLVAAILMLMLALTQSRGAIVAAILSLFLVGALRSWRNAWVYGLGGLVVTGILVIGLTQMSSLTGNVSAALGYALLRRREIWSRAVLAIIEYPLLGTGPGLFDIVIPGHWPLPYPFVGTPEHAHNLFLQIGVDLGLVGLVVMGTIYATLAVMLYRSLRRFTLRPMLPQSELYWSLSAGALASFWAMWLHGLVDAVTWGTKITFLPWLVAALATNLYLLVETKAAVKDRKDPLNQSNTDLGTGVYRQHRSHNRVLEHRKP